VPFCKYFWRILVICYGIYHLHIYTILSLCHPCLSIYHFWSSVGLFVNLLSLFLAHLDSQSARFLNFYVHMYHLSKGLYNNLKIVPLLPNSLVWPILWCPDPYISIFRVLRKIFGPKRDEVTGEWKKLHNEEFHNLYSSPNIIKQIKSMRMRWAGHMARMGEECVQGFDGKARRKETTWKTKAWMGSEWILGRLAGGV
jgi:hypothetical protein